MNHPLMPWLTMALPVVLLARPGWGADLPIVQVTIGPQGAVVERAGLLAPGDEVLSNLPADVDLTHVQLTIDGVDTPPALRLDLPPPALLPAPDQAWLAREATARAAFDACQPAMDCADLRIQLARSVLALLPVPPAAPGIAVQANPAPQAPEPAQPPGLTAAPALETPIPRPGGFDLPLPATSDQQALLHFVAGNLARAQIERHAAAQARLAAQTQLEQLDHEREQGRPPQVLSASMRLAGSGGHRVRLRYLVDQSAWTPCYRVEVAGGRVTLVSEALIDVPRDQHWDAGRLNLVTRAPADALLLRELTIPVLELGNEVVVERQLQRRRVRYGYGAARGSDSVVDAVLRLNRQTMDPGGFWTDGEWTLHATALTLLSFLGAGYDQATPNTYQATITAGLDWLRAQPIQPDLMGAALQLLVLSEAAGLSNDPQATAGAEALLSELLVRVVHNRELDATIFRRGPGAGPECMAWVLMAARSAQSAGLDAGRCHSLQEAVLALVPQLIGHSDTDATAITRLLVMTMTHGVHGETLGQPPVSAWLDHLDSWLADGRPELLYLATLGLFQYGGDAWQMWNGVVRNRLAIMHEAGLRNGFEALTPDPMGEAWARTMLTLPLEIYYRYSRLDNGRAVRSGLFGSRSGLPDPSLEPLPDVTALAHHWPVQFTIGPAPLLDGQRSRVVLSRTELPGPVRLRAAPLDGDGAWRELVTSNPLSAPLLEGPLDVVVDGERVGTGSLPFTEPGAALALELGRDDRVLVHRSEVHQDEEAWGKRTRTYTVRFAVEAPAGLYPSIRIDEAMPVPTDASIQLLSLDPAISAQDLDRHLVEDPVWHLDLSLTTAQPRAILTYQLHYPETVDPQSQSSPPSPETAPAAEHTP